MFVFEYYLKPLRHGFSSVLKKIMSRC